MTRKFADSQELSFGELPEHASRSGRGSPLVHMKRRDGLAFSLGVAGNGLQIHRVKITERIGAKSLRDAVSLTVSKGSARNLGLLFGLQIGEIP